MKQLLAIVATCTFLATGLAYAAGSSDPPKPSDMAELVKAREAIPAEKYADAIPLLEKVVAAQPQNDDAFNLLAYSQRQSDDLKTSLANYQKALAIDPSHRDAHEYVGELYLRMGDLANAEKHLKRLDSLCTFGCRQFDELEEAVAAYKKKKMGGS